MGRHSALRAADVIASASLNTPTLPSGSGHSSSRHSSSGHRSSGHSGSGHSSNGRPAASRRHAAPKPAWRRAHVLPTAAVAFTLFVGADALHLTSGIGHAEALNRGAADIAGSGIAGSGIAGNGGLGTAGAAGTDAGTVGGTDATGSGTDLSALASGAQADQFSDRVSRSSRASTSTRVSNSYTSQARPGLPAINPDKTVAGTWVRPSAGQESSCFCMRWGVMHDGIDLAGPLGSPIVAVGDGVVVAAGPAEGYGLWVVIRHDNGDYTVYGHMYHYFVTVGEHVTAGQHIADIGANGQSTGPHLHFGVMHGKFLGNYVDPVPWLKARGIDIGAYNPGA